MTVGRHELADRIGAALATAMEVHGFRRSRAIASQFPPARADDEQQAEDLTFAVGVGQSVAQEGRQRRTGDGRGILMRTPVRVRFCRRLRADHQVEDEIEAHRCEARFTDALVAMSGLNGGSDPDLGITITDVLEPVIAAGGTLFVGEVRASVLHLQPLGDDTP